MNSVEEQSLLLPEVPDGFLSNLVAIEKGNIGDCSHSQFVSNLLDFAGRTLTNRGFLKVLPVSKHCPGPSAGIVDHNAS